MRFALRGTIVVVVAAILGTGIASATLFAGANVRVSFQAWLTPTALPRSGAAPVTLHLRGRLRTTDGNQPPQLDRVTVELNRNGKLSTHGLPACPKRRILSTTTKQALRLCHGALVGHGRFTAHISIPTQPPFPAQGRVLAFSSMRHGRRVMLAHIYGTTPVPTTRVLEMGASRAGGGTFGPRFSVPMPQVAEDWGYVTGFDLTLHRLYRYKGRVHSLISAACPAPAGFKAAVFTVAKGTYYLADGRRLSRVLDGSCRVSG
jgi:hypothetical protein